MTSLSLFLVLLAALMSLVIGSLVMARDHRKLENIAFLGISLGIALWAVGIAGFVHAQSRHDALLWAKAYYFAPLLLVYASIIFAQRFLYIIKLPRLVNAVFAAAGLALAIPLLLDKTFITSQVVYRSYGKQVILNSHDYLSYSIYLLISFVLTIALAYYKSRIGRQALVRQQANIFLVGYSISCVTGVLFNLILPGFGNYSLITVGPLLTTIFLSAMSYAIVRHRLFDIRLVVARTIGYASAMVLLAAAYGLIVLGILRIFFGLHLSVGVESFLSLATGLAGLTFGGFKKQFDRLTNRLFYRDAYEPQQLFDHLNKVLVASTDLNRLLRESAAVLVESIKSDFCVIGLRESMDGPVRIIGTEKKTFTQDDIAMVRGLTVQFHDSVIVRDLLDSMDNRESKLKAVLDSNNIAMLVRLSANVHKTQEGLGYIIMGPKKSGNPYTEQDCRVLDTVAKELIIAVQNALHFEEIQNFNATLQSRVNDATRKLRRANERLKELDETKDDFISMASHQLRTPLTSVKGYISMVLEGDAGKLNEQQAKLLEQSFYSSQRMVYLISDLLNVSRLKTGKFLIEPIPVNLANMVEQEMEQLQQAAAVKGVSMTFDKPKDFPVLMLDETKTRQVIMNFADNAIYYTPSGGHIRVELNETPASVELRVVDDGIGVPKHEQHHLFTKFYRAGNARKVRPDGTGLGLFMAKKVVAGQGGAIIFESTEGKGSTFGFVFSKTKLAPSAHPDAPHAAVIK